MAAETPPLFLQAGTHTAESVRRGFSTLCESRGGICYPGDLLVSPSSGMTVSVAAGGVWIPGTINGFQGIYYCENRAATTVTHATADATNDRYDLVVAQIRDAAYSGASNDAIITIVQGTPAGSPAEPTIPANSWVLARVLITHADGTVAGGDITDRRISQVSTLTAVGQQGYLTTRGGVHVVTSTTRPTVALYEGLIVYDTDSDGLAYYDGAAFQPLGPRAQSVAVASFNPTTSFTLVTGATFSVPAGRWKFEAKAEAANLTGTTGTSDIRIQNTTDATTLDQTEIFFGSGVADRVCISSIATATFTSTKTVQLQATNSVGGANYVFNNIKYMVSAVIL